MLYSQSTSPDRFYEVAPRVDGVDPFEMWLDVNGVRQLQKIRGTYEVSVLRAIVSHLEDDDMFWEVGARWGYFSLAVANRATQVIAFEESQRRVELINKSIQRNGFKNITIVTGRVGEEVDLVEFPVPDVVLMDIEGWEHRVLSTTLERLEQKPTWIVEIHDPEYLYDVPSHANPTGVYEQFDEHGYRVRELRDRTKGNYHIVAEPKQ